MGKINYKKLEKIAIKRDADFEKDLLRSFQHWAHKYCKTCICNESLEACSETRSCNKIQKFYKSGYYKSSFLTMPEYREMKFKKRGKVYEETSGGFTRKVNAARKEHVCRFCGKTIRIGSPYLSTMDFVERKVWCSCDDCHKTITWMYGD